MWNVIIPAMMTLAGMYFGNKGSGSPSSPSEQLNNLMTPQMKEMLDLQLERMRKQEPLYNDVMGMARGMLPTRYRGAVPARPHSSDAASSPGMAYHPNPAPGDYPGTSPKPGPTQGQPGGWTPPQV